MIWLIFTKLKLFLFFTKVEFCRKKSTQLKTISFLFLLVILVAAFTEGVSNPVKDSLQVKEKKYTIRGMARIHSQGQFWYGGRIVSPNPTLDMNFTYDRKQWGFFLFKALDLKSNLTDINFMLAAVNKNFHLNKRLTITPSVGFLFEQKNSFADKGTDAVFILQSSYKLSNKFTIDHSALIGNLLIEPSEKDWVNRFRLLYSHKHIDITAWLWHNNKVFDNAEYVSSTLSLFYSRIKLSDHLLLNVGASGTLMPYSSDEVNYPKKNGMLFTLAVIAH